MSVTDIRRVTSDPSSAKSYTDNFVSKDSSNNQKHRERVIFLWFRVSSVGYSRPNLFKIGDALRDAKEGKKEAFITEGGIALRV